MSTQQPESRASGVAVYVLLFVLGILQGLIGSFQYSRSPAPLIAIILDVVIFATCAGGGWAMKSFAGGLVPALGWMAVSFVLSTGSTEGTVIITATAPGEWYLYGGMLAAAAGAGASFVRWARPAGRPRLRVAGVEHARPCGCRGLPQISACAGRRGRQVRVPGHVRFPGRRSRQRSGCGETGS
jgi:hypothetical protein